MSWIIIASFAPLFWAVSCLIDEYLLQKYFKNENLIIVIVGNISALALAVGFFIFEPAGLLIPLRDMFYLALIGVWFSICIVPYMYAVSRGGASISVPLFSFMPVFVFILGWLFLGETVTTQQMLGGLVILLAAFGVVWVKDIKYTRWDVLLLMMVCCLGFSVQVVLMRYATFHYDWRIINAWIFVGAGVFSLLLLTFYAPWRQRSIGLVKGAGKLGVVLLFVQGLFDVLALAMNTLALSLAPAAALVMALESTQPFYIIILTALTGVLADHKFKNVPRGRKLLRQLFCFTAMICGVYLIAA